MPVMPQVHMLEIQMSELDECSRPRLRSRVKTDKPSASSTISSSDSLDTRPVCEPRDRASSTCADLHRLSVSHMTAIVIL